MKPDSRLIDAVGEVYDWIDSHLRQNSSEGPRCQVCGECCDFDGFDHRLFVTSPELIYFTASLGTNNIKPMRGGRCPYNIDGRCEIYRHRFAGCRIFSCKDDRDLQSELTEAAIEKFKSICEEFDIGYRYTDLPAALNEGML